MVRYSTNFETGVSGAWVWREGWRSEPMWMTRLTHEDSHFLSPTRTVWQVELRWMVELTWLSMEWQPDIYECSVHLETIFSNTRCLQVIQLPPRLPQFCAGCAAVPPSPHRNMTVLSASPEMKSLLEWMVNPVLWREGIRRVIVAAAPRATV
jgi:hypothetical protein